MTTRKMQDAEIVRLRLALSIAEKELRIAQASANYWRRKAGHATTDEIEQSAATEGDR